MMPVFAAAPLLPALLTCAAVWAIVIWALKQRDPLTRVVHAVTRSHDCDAPHKVRKIAAQSITSED